MYNNTDYPKFGGVEVPCIDGNQVGVMRLKDCRLCMFAYGKPLFCSGSYIVCRQEPSGTSTICLVMPL